MRLPQAPLRYGVCPKSGDTSLTRSCGCRRGRPARSERLTGWLEAAPKHCRKRPSAGASLRHGGAHVPCGELGKAVGQETALACGATAGRRLAHATLPRVLMRPAVLPRCRKFCLMCLIGRSPSPKVIRYQSRAWLSASAWARCHSLHCHC